MRHVPVIVMLVALTSSANATIQIFYTSSASPYGLAKPENVWAPTRAYVTDAGEIVNRFDLTDQGGGVPYTLLGGGQVPDAGDATVDIARGEFLYVWLKFAPTNEPANARVLGLDLIPQAPLSRAAYYALLDQNIARWDCTAADLLSGAFQTTGEQVLVAVQSAGLKNASNAAIAWNLAKNRTFLLGAVQPAATGVFSYALGVHGIGLDSFGGDPVQTQSAIASITVTPEPGGLALLGFAGLLLRRR